MADQNSNCQPNNWLVFGGNGWIGSQLITLLKELQSKSIIPDRCKSVVEEDRWPQPLPINNIIVASSRLENRSDVAKELDEVKPQFVINCAGLTGRPNVDWCEDNKLKVIRVNIIGTLNLMDLCNIRGIKVTNFATGCIYQYDEEHLPRSGNTFKEDDQPNFNDSFYSHTKAMMDNIVRYYDNILTLRLRMPISDDLSDRSFLTKITRYEKVINIPNSMTVLYDLLPIAIHMTITGKVGVYNFTNPGVLSHNEILDRYIQYIDSNFTYINFTIEEQNKILKAARSNNELDVTKLCSEYPLLPSINQSIEKVMTRIKLDENS